MDKQKFYGGDEKKLNMNINPVTPLNNDLSMELSTLTNNNQIQIKIDKYKDFFFILKEDLKKTSKTERSTYSTTIILLQFESGEHRLD